MFTKVRDAERQHKRTRVGKKSTSRREKPLFLRLPPAYHEALTALSEKNRRTLTAEAMLALEAHFEKNGVRLLPQITGNPEDTVSRGDVARDVCVEPVGVD